MQIIKSVLADLRYPLSQVPQKGLFVTTVAVSHLLMLISPLLMGRMISALSDSISKWELTFAIFGAVVFVTLLSFVVGSWCDWVGARVFIRAERNLRADLWKRIHAAPMPLLEKTAPGEWMHRISGDVSMLCNISNNLIKGVVGFLIVFFGTLLVVLLKVPALSIAFLILAALSLFFYRRMNKRVKYASRRQRESYYRMGSSILDLLEMSSLLRIFGASADYHSIIDASTQRLENSKLLARYIHEKFSWILRFEMLAAQLIVLGVCTWLCLRGGLRVGEIVAYDMLFAQMTSYLSQFMYLLPEFDMGRECLVSLKPLLSLEAKAGGAVHPPSTSESREIRLENVSFGYERGQRLIIDRFSATIRPGEYVSFLGRNGSGKTTLLKLILGIYEPTEGQILINRTGVTFVPQRVVVYRDSLLENIRLRDETISAACVDQVVTRCRLRHIANRLPQGLDGIINQNELSGGELQCLGIARALVRNPGLLVVDEIANNLDIVSKEQINEILGEIKHQSTIISVTHDFSYLEHTDRIFLFTKDGILEMDSDTPKERMRLALERIRRESLG